MSLLWPHIQNLAEIPSPALIVFTDRIRENIRRMIACVGDPQRLRPHVKTHKMAEVVRMQMGVGITKFKAATIAEAEMTAAAGAVDVLLAYQPVGPNIARLRRLAQKFPDTRFSAVADDAEAVRAMSKDWSAAGQSIDILLDVDCGMHRTGIEPGPRAVELYRLMASLPGLKAGGLHAYDGHNRAVDFEERKAQTAACMEPVRALRQTLLDQGLPVPRLVAGGSPTFPVHALHDDVECSPGTMLLWDAGYGNRFPDMDYLHAAVVLTRVVSKPGRNRLCLDLGHKAIAAENPHPRVQLIGLEDAVAVTHSEEHLVVETSKADAHRVGDCVYGIPMHICPTVALHGRAVVVEGNRAVGHWKVVARERQLGV